MGVMQVFSRAVGPTGGAARGHGSGRFPARCLLLLMVALIVAPVNADAASYCVYNKTRQLTVAISRDKSALSLAAGAHFCCKANDALCGSGLASGAPLWRVESFVERRAVWCGPADERDPRSSGLISLPTKDSYLLVRDSRLISMTPPAAPPAASAGAPNAASSVPNRPATALQRAPLDVDVMSVDGRLLRTLPCQFAG